MSLYQSSFYPSSAQIMLGANEETQTTIQYDRTYLLDALNKGQIALSLSPLLGCDYVFIKHASNETLLDDDSLQRTLHDVLRLLSLTPKQSIFISVVENDSTYQFTRFDFEWNNQSVEPITKTSIDQQEQSDFMEMIYSCSSPI